MANTAAQIQQLYIAYFNRPADPAGLNYWTASTMSLKSIAESFAVQPEYAANYAGKTTTQVVAAIYVNLFGHAADPAGLTYWVSEINGGNVTLGAAALSILNGATGADKIVIDNKTVAATTFSSHVDTTAEMVAYAGADANQAAKAWLSAVKDPVTLAAATASVDATIAAISVAPPAVGTSFVLGTDTAAGAKVMHLTGDQGVRIDFTNTNSTAQIKGLDLNGNGVIENNGVENNSPVVHDASGAVVAATGYVIVDAYARNKLNENDVTSNFKGDIAFDGTGFQGDGVSTDGNIYLGGLGVDTVFTGIGNDFLAGGGVAAGRFVRVDNGNGTGTVLKDTLTGKIVDNARADSLSGGRNADFFFVELSAIDATDGSSLTLNGGSTSDLDAAGNNSAQDADWLLLEASDDDEAVTINLNRNTNPNLVNSTNPIGEQNQFLRTESGKQVNLHEIENIDASGNLFGFIDGMNTTLGGRTAPHAAGTVNDGIGSTAQLNIIGSDARNVIIGGYDNDSINGGAGNDLLMGGNLRKLINPNILAIPNDGVDQISGGTGSDGLVFEADGGLLDGNADSDTLYLTDKTLGASNAADMLADGIIRLDLGVGASAAGVDNYAGYGGADLSGDFAGTNVNATADQSNYNNSSQTTIQNVENVIATGLGAVDFNATGNNTAADLAFANQQNFMGYKGDLTLRGTTTANTLYANTGKDVLEGREGNDKLSGGDGDDDFVFALVTGEAGDALGDRVDVIHRQADLNNDNLWDGYSAVTGLGGNFVQDFGINSTSLLGSSALTVDFGTTNLASADVDLATFSIKIGGVVFAVTDVDALASLKAATTVAAVAAIVNTAFHAQDANVSAVVSGSKVVITDATPTGGRDMSDTVAEGYGVSFAVSNGVAQANASFAPAGSTVTQDRLIYRSYEDRADNESVDDSAITGSIISLGVDAYAQDLVISFGADGTRIAEDQAYTLDFTNLTTQDKVTIAVNGVTYVLQVGVDLDGNSIAGEDGVGENQALIQFNFLTRYATFINTFMDNDTASGRVIAAFDGGNTITLTQATYNAEQTVFMTKPVVTLQNLSNGEPSTVEITNTSQHEVFLLGFDGRDNKLNTTNVLFYGDHDVQQATLETTKNGAGTAQTLTGKDAVLIDGGVDDLVGIVQNTATNAQAGIAGFNFSVHGDDFLIGGTGNDTIKGGTGDDRVIGSLGTDVLDGGKNYYAVKVLGETEARVVLWNVWEKNNPTSAQSLLADPTLAGKVLSSITLIDQNQNGSTLQSGEFSDTLQYNQGDFTTGATRFTVTLNNFTTTGAVVNLNNGGAGTVTTDVTGNGATADDVTSTFTNFENLRTVSGTGLAVAGVNGGQGNDTLNVAALSTATGGISYDLTNNVDAPGTATGAGKVSYSANAHASLTKPAVGDFESKVILVDGVESVIGGLGDDLLLIDETEAAKDNSFDGGGAGVANGDDRVIYQNVFDAAPATDKIAQPTVTIKVNTSTDVDQVTMTNGRVGSTVATDTLTSVEFITLDNGTATSARENDVLDVRAMVAGAIVSYVDGTVKTTGGVTQVTIDNLYQVENVIADGDDTVVVASSGTMNLNTRSDTGVDATAAKDLTFSTFLDYDELTGANARVAFGSLAGGAGAGAGEIENWFNEAQFTFNLGTVGADTVDYSLSTDAISARVELNVDQANQYVLVDSSAGAFDATLAAGDRVDVLTSVERIIASQAESVLDLTTSTKGLEIKFNSSVLADRVADSATTNAYDLSSVRISDLSTASPLTRSYAEYRDATDVVAQAGSAVNRATATWNRIEGSDNAERVITSSAHSLDSDTFNLRGGANEVKYNELTKSITLSLAVSDFVAATPLTTGLVTGTVTFQDGNSAALVGGGTHTITSYTSTNTIAAGSLRIAASQDAEDTLQLAGLAEKLFLLSEIGTIDNQITVKLGSGAAANSVILTGFELVADAATNDVYDFGSLINAAAGIDLTDNAANDHDTVKVGNDAIGFDGTILAGAAEISLGAINTSLALSPAGFDFDVLDVTKVTSAALTTLTGVAAGEGTDEVVIGNIAGITDALLFEAVVLTNATVTENGTTFTLNTTTNKLIAGAKSVNLTDLANTLSFGGLVLEQPAASPFLRDAGALNVTSGLAINVVGLAGENANITGGNGADTITGAGGDDTLRGGSGNDTLDGSFTAAIAANYTVTLSGGASVLTAAADFLTIGGTTITAALVPAGANQVVVGADSDQVGAAFAAIPVATWITNLQTAGASLAEASTLVSVTYDAVTNKLALNFGTGADSVSLAIGDFATGIDLTGGTITGVEALTAVVPRVETTDTFVFEKTAALNGADTINNFDATLVTGDILNFTAFLGAAAVEDTVAVDLAAVGGLDLTGQTVGVAFNKASLSASDIGILAAAGKVTIADNGKAVVLVTGDVNGVADITNDAYKVYYVEDTNTSITAQTWVVTLVGTVNSAAELNAMDVAAAIHFV